MNSNIRKIASPYRLVVGSILILLGAISCIESFPVVSRDYDRVLVVEARLTDRPDGHVVKLSYTRTLNEPTSDRLTNATVWVESANGQKIVYEEIQPGWYVTDSSARGVPGMAYQLIVQTADGDEYRSNVQTLRPSPPIDDIFYEYKELVVSPEEPVYPGIQFFVSTQDPSNQARHFRYEWSETYEIRPPFPSLYEFASDPDTVFPRRQPIHICYTTEISQSLILGSTAGLTENRLAGLNVRYLTNQTDHLKYAYSLQVTQYAISPEAYTYYRQMLERDAYSGSLFDRQVGALTGNIYSVNTPEEMVLGFFEVAGVSERRTFLKFAQLDDRFPAPADKFECAAVQIDTILRLDQPPPYTIPDSVAFYINSKGYDVIEALYCDQTRLMNDSCAFYFRALVAPKYCTDCRYRGSTQKPSFWIY